MATEDQTIVPAFEVTPSMSRSGIAPAKGSLASAKLNPELVESYARPQSESDELKLAATLYESLRTLRSNIVQAAGKGVKLYHIFHNATLENISTRMPRTNKELLEIHGISKRKVMKYGDQVLETIESTIKEFYNTSSGSNGGTDSVKRRGLLASAKGSLAFEKANFEQVEFPAPPQSEVELKLSATLYESLRTLRSNIVQAAGEGVKLYHIFHNATLENISRRIPRTKEELLGVHGIGKAKATEYGDQVLETIESTIKKFYITEKTSSASNGCTNLAKRKRYSLAPSIENSEMGQELMDNTGRSRAKVTKVQNINTNASNFQPSD